MLKKLMRFLLSANLSEEQYEKAKDDMYRNNVMMLRVLASIATFIFVICTVLGLFVANMRSKMPMYVIGLIFSVVVLVAALFSHNRKLHSFCMGFFDALLLSVGLLITLVSAPTQLTVTLIPIAILLPLFFDVKPYKFLAAVGTADLIYAITAPFVKPSEILVLDMVDVLAFSAAGILIGTVITKVKIERYAYAREISEAATHDGLTACYNRTAYNVFLREKNENIPKKLAVVMIDINGLKRLNDTRGHEAGDEMIITVAKAMRSVFDEFGMCFRIGGDEFVAFPETDASKLEELIASFRKILSENNGKLVQGITVSVGAALADADNAESLEALVNLADQRMYEDKKNYYSRTDAE